MKKHNLFDFVETNREVLNKIALDIWDNPELALEEHFACKLHKDYLAAEGFLIKEIPNCPTCFVAEYGSGHPIVGITGEYDALPNLSQKACSKQMPAKNASDPGHGCGHNLLGVGSLGAAVATKRAMEEENLSGTLRYYGCAAEEILSGKPPMAKEHVFDDLDGCISWHPDFVNTVTGGSYLAMNSIKFRFKGIPSHASASPETGRSALDAVELMNVGANYLREHVIDSVRIHYAITNGGGMPNTVPADAEVWYYVRAPHRAEVRETTARLLKVAEGAAMMTETQMSYELLAGCYDVIVNRALSENLLENMLLVKSPRFDEADFSFAKEFATHLSLTNNCSSMNNEDVLQNSIDCDVEYGKPISGSSDVGDVSHITPYAQANAACWPIGFAAHTWIACACSGSALGLKGMIFAAKTMAGTLYDMLTKPELIQNAQAEFKIATNGKSYVSPFEEEF